MSHTDLSELLERAAGPPPGGPDTVSLWQRGRRRRRTKRIAPVGGLVAVAVAIAVTTAGADLPPDPMEIDPADTPRVEQLPQVPLPDLDAAPAELPMLEQPTGSMVIASRDGTARFIDVDRRQVIDRRMEELAPGDPIERLIVGDRLVLYGGATTYVMDPDPAAAPEPLIAGAGPSVFVASGTSDRVWVGTVAGPLTEIVQVDLEGTVLLGPTESPGGSLAVGLRDTVVLQRDDGLVVWDPATNSIVHTVEGPFPMGTDGDRFAWCDATCRRLYLTDPAAGSTDLLAELPEQASFAGYDGRISPDGRYLATPVCVGDQDERRCALTVIDLDDHRAWTVADGLLRGYDTPAWSPDSRWVFTHLTDDHLAAYRPGQAEAAQIDIDPTRRPYGFGVASAPSSP